jgi:hypothetical protein
MLSWCAPAITGIRILCRSRGSFRVRCCRLMVVAVRDAPLPRENYAFKVVQGPHAVHWQARRHRRGWKFGCVLRTAAVGCWCSRTTTWSCAWCCVRDPRCITVAQAAISQSNFALTLQVCTSRRAQVASPPPLRGRAKQARRSLRVTHACAGRGYRDVGAAARRVFWRAAGPSGDLVVRRHHYLLAMVARGGYSHTSCLLS